LELLGPLVAIDGIPNGPDPLVGKVNEDDIGRHRRLASFPALPSGLAHCATITEGDKVVKMYEVEFSNSFGGRLSLFTRCREGVFSETR